MHPLINNANELSETELEEKIFKLNRIYFSTHNDDTRRQVVLALDTFKAALEEKKIQERKKQQDQDDSGLDILIKIS